MNKFVLATLLIAMFASGFVLGFNMLSVYRHRDPQVNANVYVLVENVNGITEFRGGNVITDLLELNLRNTYGFYNDTVLPNSTNMTKYISLGNATVAQTLTIITDECTANGFDRQLGTVTAWDNGTDKAFNVTKMFTATGTETFNTTGLNWFATDDSDGNLAAVAAITQTTFAVGDNCTITWVITFDAN